jgi:hypothetical protein
MVHIINKYNGPTAVLASRRPGSNESWFGKGGELNAGSNIEVMQSFATLMSEVASGRVKFVDPDQQETAGSMTPAERRQMIVDAYYDHTTAAWAETGSTIGAVLYETATREGFMRRFLEKGELQNGAIPRIQLRFQNVQALVATSPTTVAPQIAVQKYIYPPEFYVLGNVRVEERDIAQGAADIMDDTYARALEMVNVQEDRTYIMMLNNTVGAANPQYLLSGGMTPSNLASARTAILTWGLPAEQLLLSADFWTDIAGNASAFGNLFDPVTQYELVQTGFLGTLLGMGVTTDGFRDPNQRVVASNDMYILSSPVNHGAFTDRGPVNSKPIDTYPDGIPARGWFFYELLTQVVANPRSVVKARRV